MRLPEVLKIKTFLSGKRHYRNYAEGEIMQMKG
jgi:hypothetical protein